MRTKMKKTPTIAWSTFALKQNEKGHHSQFVGRKERLLELVRKHWHRRVPGVGRKDLKQVVVVPILEENLHRMFRTPWGHVKDAHHLRAKVTRRQEHEDPYIEVHGKGKRLKVKFAKVVLYSADTLLENDGDGYTIDREMNFRERIDGGFVTIGNVPWLVAHLYVPLENEVIV